MVAALYILRAPALFARVCENHYTIAAEVARSLSRAVHFARESSAIVRNFIDAYLELRITAPDPRH